MAFKSKNFTANYFAKIPMNTRMVIIFFFFLQFQTDINTFDVIYQIEWDYLTNRGLEGKVEQLQNIWQLCYADMFCEDFKYWIHMQFYLLKNTLNFDHIFWSLKILVFCNSDSFHLYRQSPFVARFL